MADTAHAQGATPLPTPDLPTAFIAEAGTRLRGRHVVLVPGESLPLIALDLPQGLRGAARERVAQRQLTDMLGADAEAVQMRPFTPEGGADGWTRVLLADRAQMALWRGQVGRRCIALLPDYLALPVAKGLWTVAAEGARVRVRFGTGDAATTSEPALCLQAAQHLSGGQRPEQILRYGDPLPRFEAQMAEAGIPILSDPAKVAAEAASMRAFGQGELTLDLRADPQAARTRLLRQIGAWRWPVLTAAVAAALWAAAQLTVIRATEAETAALTSGILQTTRQSFVPSGPILDIRVQVARVLAEKRAALRADAGQVSPLDVFAMAAPVIVDAGAVPQSIAWNAGGGLRMVLTLNDFGAVDALVESLSSQDLQVTIQDARLSEGTGKVTADIEVGLPEGDG
jgi:general secretion pathway protein L